MATKLDSRGTLLQNKYALDPVPISPDELRKALSGDFEGFKYYFENLVQIQDKDTRRLIHPKMNKGQERIARRLFSYIAKATRVERRKDVVILSSRQIGKSVLVTSIINYVLAFANGCENLTLAYTLQTSGAAQSFLDKKFLPLITGVHPDIFPNIYKKSNANALSLYYSDIRGRIIRNSYCDVVSAGANSIRSGTVNIWIADEPSEYAHPEVTEDAISGAIPDYGFSLVVFISTFSDRMSPYFLNKVKTAIEHPEEMDFVFVPWFLVYGRKGDGDGVDLETLSDYEKEVIIPAMKAEGISPDEFADKIGWYRTKSLKISTMRYEYPTTLEDILSITDDAMVFSEALLKKQEPNILSGQPYRLVTDNLSGEVKAEPAEASDFMVFVPPVATHRYKLIVDPITSFSEDSDYFAMQVWDDNTLEQVAAFNGKGYMIEDYADFAVAIAKLYNKAIICPEANVAEAFLVAVRQLRYYNFFYTQGAGSIKGSHGARERVRQVGIRTTASSKESMIDKIILLLSQDKIKIHDSITLEQMRNFVKKKKKRSDGSVTIRMEAQGHGHDDQVACLWIYAGSLTEKQLDGRKKSELFVL